MKRSIVLCSAAFSLAALAFGGVQATAAPNELQRTAQELVDAGAPSFVVRVNDGTSIRTATTGLGDLGTGRRVKNKDQYQAGSQTKSFVAVLVLQLVAEGKVQLDEPIQTYLPGMVPNGQNITVRMLLQHTSGLADFNTPELVTQILANPYQHGTPQQVLAAAFSHKPDFAPGTSWSYSNTGYVVIGEMLQKLTGKPVHELLQQRIARPLKLNDTYLPDKFVQNTGPGFLRAYYVDVSSEPAVTHLTSDWTVSHAYAAGSLVSTARDLSTFYSALLSGKVLGKAELAEMKKTTVVSGNTTFDADYGLGLYPFTNACGTAWGHSGGIFGSISHSLVSADGTRSMAWATGGNLLSLEENDPEIHEWADAFVKADDVAICAMFGKPVPAAPTTLKATRTRDSDLGTRVPAKTVLNALTSR